MYTVMNMDLDFYPIEEIQTASLIEAKQFLTGCLIGQVWSDTWDKLQTVMYYGQMGGVITPHGFDVIPDDVKILMIPVQ